MLSDDAPDAAADPWDDPPDEPTEALTIKLVTPDTIDVTICFIKPNESDPPFLLNE